LAKEHGIHHKDTKALRKRKGTKGKKGGKQSEDDSVNAMFDEGDIEVDQKAKTVSGEF
jgi:hypothetical protein